MNIVTSSAEATTLMDKELYSRTFGNPRNRENLIQLVYAWLLAHANEINTKWNVWISK